MPQAKLNTWRADEQNPNALDDEAEKWFGDRKPKAVMGWNGIRIWDDTVDPVALLAAFLEKTSDESCGQCTPCRLGTAVMADLSRGLADGKGKKQDLEKIAHMAVQISKTARCDIGRTLAKPVLDLMDAFRDTFARAADRGLKNDQDEYAAVVTAPCISACPSHLDIPFYLENVRMDRWSQAMDAVRNDCPMPGTIGRVCVRPCEAACRRGKLDEPLGVRAVKRFLADKEMDGEFEPATPEPERRSEKVAVIGAGPAGLSCAYYLGRLGVEATIFEAQEGPGGMAAYGIPSYRLPRNIIAHEVAMVEKMGAKIQYNTAVGRDITMEDLEDRGYKAVFIGSGAPDASSMRCKGEDEGYENFMPGVEFLARAARGEHPLTGKRVAVIGGGNVAMDCVRTARRIGFEDVNLIYRRTEAEMPADPVEIREAKEEGVIFHVLMAPAQIVAENGKVKGLECLRMELGEPDKSGRRRPVPVEGSQFIMDCDAVIPAIGQVGAVDQFLSDKEELISAWNTLVVDQTTFQSKEPVIFGGGDCATGPDTLIAALAAGKKAARFIFQYLDQGNCRVDLKEMLEKMSATKALFEPDAPFCYPGCTEQVEAPVLAPDTRIENFNEVEKGYSAVQARKESARCLRCYRILMAAF